MPDHLMSGQAACELLAALDAHGVDVCVGGGWAIDALVREQTRSHADLGIWVDAVDMEPLFVVFVDRGLDRIYPWPGDRPWNFVLHDGQSRRVDLHMYERLDKHRLRYGSVADPFLFQETDLSGSGEIAGTAVRCEIPEFALANRAGYELRESDRHDLAVLCDRFGLDPRRGSPGPAR